MSNEKETKIVLVKTKDWGNGKATIYYEEDGVDRAVVIEYEDEKGSKKEEATIIKELQELAAQEVLADTMSDKMALWKQIAAISEDDFSTAIKQIKEILLNLS